eukprot:1438319-Pleurochrysis_carterae.AAC.2
MRLIGPRGISYISLHQRLPLLTPAYDPLGGYSMALDLTTLIWRYIAPNAIDAIAISRRYCYKARLFTFLVSSPSIKRFALVSRSLFETDAARRSFGPACTVSHFALAPHAYLRSLTAQSDAGSYASEARRKV